MSLAEIIKTALDEMKVIAKTETVVGDPIIAGEVTLIPVSRVSIGFAAGGAGERAQHGAGSGGGINITPVAFIVVTGEKVQVQPLTPADPVLQKILSLAPDVITNVATYFKKRDKKGKKPLDDAPDAGT